MNRYRQSESFVNQQWVTDLIKRTNAPRPQCRKCGQVFPRGKDGLCVKCADKAEICECGRDPEDCAVADGAEKHGDRR